MAKKILTFILVCISSVCLFVFTACDGVTDNAKQAYNEAVDAENKNDGTASDNENLNSLQLLSFETVKKEKSEIVDDKQVLNKLSAVKIYETKKNKIEEIETADNVEVVATVKNLNRDSFIDLVLYVSYLDTKIVFNEGNGEYVCASTTILKDGIWVTDITLSLNLIFDEDYTCNIEIDEINFLHGGKDVLHTDLNNANVRRIDYGFTGDLETEYAENGQFRQGNFVYEKLNENEVVIVGNAITEETDLIIPSSVVIGKNYKNKNGTEYVVAEIGSGAFSGCKFINSLVVPNTVRHIRNNAFKNCGRIKADIVDSTDIEENAFAHTVLLTLTNQLSGDTLLHNISVQDVQTVFAENEQSEYIILYDNDKCRKSSEFISYHILQATGAELPVMLLEAETFDINAKNIIIGSERLFAQAGLEFSAEDLGKTGYYIKTVGNSVFIMANGEEGYQLAAIAFLREVAGYDYLASDCVVYRKTATYLPQMEIIEKPDYEIRSIMDVLSDEDKYAMGFSADKYFGITGINGLVFHNTFVWLPPTEFYAEHPAWYTDGFYNNSGELCYTAHGDKDEYESMQNTVLQKMIKLIEDDSDLDYISFMQQDNLDYCKCPSCSACYLDGCYSATIIKFVNDLDLRLQSYLQEQADKTQTAKREVGIVFFAYQYSLKPPVIDEFAYMSLNDNVAVIVVSPNSNVEDLSATVFDWGRVCKHVFVWHYDTSLINYLVPYPVFSNEYVDLREAGAERFMAYGQYDQGTATGFNAFKNYVLSKIGFDIYTDVSDLENRWFSEYYLDASDIMQEYYDNLQINLKNIVDNSDNFNIFGNYLTKENFPLENVLQYKRYINYALLAVEKYREEDENLYNALIRRIKTESVFPDYVLCELYSDVYSQSELSIMRSAFKSDCIALGVTKLAAYRNIETLFTAWGI